jgi:hypothetical protein
MITMKAMLSFNTRNREARLFLESIKLGTVIRGPRQRQVLRIAMRIA